MARVSGLCWQVLDDSEVLLGSAKLHGAVMAFDSRGPAAELAVAIATGLAEVVPRGFAVRASGDWIRCASEGEPDLDVEVAAPPDEAGDDVGFFEGRIETVLDNVQDCVIESLGHGWPGVGPADSSSVLPRAYARVVDGHLELGYRGDAMAVDLPPIDLALLSSEPPS